MECPCRRCRRLFRPTLESLYSGSPYWWYCPACQDQQCPPEAQQALGNQLSAAQGQAHLHRRLGQESDPERVVAELEEADAGSSRRMAPRTVH